MSSLLKATEAMVWSGEVDIAVAYSLKLGAVSVLLNVSKCLRAILHMGEAPFRAMNCVTPEYVLSILKVQLVLEKIM